MPEPTVSALKDSRKLWSTLEHFHLPWGEPPPPETAVGEAKVTLQFVHDAGGLRMAWAPLYTSENFRDLLAGEGDYGPEELDDPYSVLEERNDYAATLLERYQAEIAALFGQAEQFGEDFTPRRAWHLPQLTLCLEVAQADQACPIEVRLTLLPPGQWPEHWNLYARRPMP